MALRENNELVKVGGEPFCFLELGKMAERRMIAAEAVHAISEGTMIAYDPGLFWIPAEEDPAG